jgi:hypothetical protein
MIYEWISDTKKEISPVKMVAPSVGTPPAVTVAWLGPILLAQSYYLHSI